MNVREIKLGKRDGFCRAPAVEFVLETGDIDMADFVSLAAKPSISVKTESEVINASMKACGKEGKVDGI